MSPFEKVMAEIDRSHREDPAGKELDYARRMTARLMELDANPDPLLRIAVRAQHMKRWECPRTQYPAGRKGYLEWRRHAAEHHAKLVAELLRRAGYGDADVDRAVALVKKRGLGRDQDTQTLEDCACLVFLESELSSFAAKHAKSKVDDIVRKTWRKMSPAAQRLANALVPPPPAQQ